MGRIRIAAVVIAAVAGLLAAPAAASARPAESVYTTSRIDRCFGGDGLEQCVRLQAYTTYSSSQVWINGKVSCTPAGSQVTLDITWCGVGGGNGTGYLNIGVNWNAPALNAYNLYERMNIVKNGEGCTTIGTNWRVGDISLWNNRQVYCEVPA